MTREQVGGQERDRSTHEYSGGASFFFLKRASLIETRDMRVRKARKTGEFMVGWVGRCEVSRVGPAGKMRASRPAMTRLV